MKNSTKINHLILAGLCGGLAEVIWIGLYSTMSDVSLSTVGSAVASTVFSGGSELLLTPVSGLMVHLMLSIVLALGFGYLIWPLIDRLFQNGQSTMITSIVVLVLVWKINFFLLLPVWNPEFIGLMPLGITLVSKILFGVTMGAVLTLSKHKLATQRL